MALIQLFVCDGCSKESPKPEGDQLLPSGWQKVTIKLTGLTMAVTSLPNPNGPHDLCQKCTQKIICAVNPRNWARAKAEAGSNG